MINFEKVGDLGYYMTPEFEGEKVNARWGGKARELLGLPEQFDPVMFERVLNGRNPHDGEKLSARLSKVRRQGWDATITDEKVSSALELIAGDERITGLKRDANDYAMNRIEKAIATRVRKGGANDDRVTGNALWATFEHATNRDGVVHRHHHNILCNMTHDKGEAQWKAVELSKVLNKTEIKKIERAHTKFITNGLKKLGYKVKSFGHRYEVMGVDYETIDKLSTGSQRVKGKKKEFNAASKAFTKQKALERGLSQEEAEKMAAKPLSPKAAAKLPLYDRPPKVGSGTREAMRQSWISKLNDFEHHCLRSVVAKAKAVVKRIKWREESRSAFDRMQSHEVEQGTPTQERSHGRSR